MPNEPDHASPSAELRDGIDTLWTRLLTHPFVMEMAAGNLPPEKYLFYVQQNLLYLPQYARAIAWGAAKSTDDQGLRAFTRSLDNIVNVEIAQNQRLRDRVAQLTAVRHPHASVLAPATLAYTSYLLATAAQGDALDIQALILPCAWSYGAIATHLTGQVVDHPVYSEWFAFFAGADYSKLVENLRQEFDESTRSASPAQKQRLPAIFATATRLEAGFWDMGYTSAHWPDLQPGHAAPDNYSQKRP